MTLDELDKSLSGGFHDSELLSLAIDYRARLVTMTVDLCVGDPDGGADRREARRVGTVLIAGLKFIAIEPPDPRYPFTRGARRLDLSEVSPGSAAWNAARASSAGFVSRLFVSDWNAFLDIAADRATLVWTGAEGERGASPERIEP